MVHVRLWLEVDEGEWMRRFDSHSQQEARQQVKEYVLQQVKGSQAAEDDAIVYVGLEREPLDRQQARVDAARRSHQRDDYAPSYSGDIIN